LVHGKNTPEERSRREGFEPALNERKKRSPRERGRGFIKRIRFDNVVTGGKIWLEKKSKNRLSPSKCWRDFSQAGRRAVPQKNTDTFRLVGTNRGLTTEGGNLCTGRKAPPQELNSD